MKSKNMIDRRSFIGTTTTAAAGLILPKGGIFNIMKKEDFPSTKDFWYRRVADGPFIDTQLENLALGFTDNQIMLSHDNCHTWSDQLGFWDAKNITFSHIFKNGNLLIGTRNRLYLSTDSLKTIKEIAVKNPDGSDYLPHVSKDPDYPGWYFFTLPGENSWMINGKEMLVWGNYSNVEGGSVPVNIYYSIDNGHTVKIAYSFGQNPRFKDVGDGKDKSQGTLLGNPDNPKFCRHVHCVTYSPSEDAFYACTGDGRPSDGAQQECKWLKGRYNAIKDEWTWEVLIEVDFNSRYKSGGINFVDGKLYFTSDANGKEPYDRGIFRCDPADFLNKEKHELLYQPDYEVGHMLIQDGIIIAGYYAVASPYKMGVMYSSDMGKTWRRYDLKEYGPRSIARINYKNSEGWFRMDLRSGWIHREEVLFIKPK